jgi:hypothetical protein
VRLYDPEAGAVQDVRPGPLRIHVHGADLRVHVVADVLRRVAERRRRSVLLGPPREPPLDELNVKPSNWQPDGDADLHVSDQLIPGRCLLVAPSPASWPDTNPLSIRLAMLRTHYREPLVADASLDQLERWRDLVAEWANSPGKPMAASYVAAAEEALGDDLNTPAALATMDRLATDPEISPGSKFESFVHLDLILALDLVSAIGR